MDGETAKVIDEIVLRHASTQQACEEFVNRYGRHRAQVQVLGDASGHQQRTTGNTDYKIIEEYLKAYTNLEVEYLAARSNPSVRERVVMVNRLLRSASGVTRVVVDEKCEELIKDFEQVAFKEDTFTIDKDRDRMRTHISDALGYVLWEKFEPMGTIGECTVRIALMTETINREHPEYAARRMMWRQYKDLYAGGEDLRRHAAEYLVRRHKEPTRDLSWNGWAGCSTRTTLDRLSIGTRRR